MGNKNSQENNETISNLLKLQQQNQQQQQLQNTNFYTQDPLIQQSYQTQGQKYIDMKLQNQKKLSKLQNLAYIDTNSVKFIHLDSQQDQEEYNLKFDLFLCNSIFDKNFNHDDFQNLVDQEIGSLQVHFGMCQQVNNNQGNQKQDSVQFLKLPAVNDYAFTYEHKLTKKQFIYQAKEAFNNKKQEYVKVKIETQPSYQSHVYNFYNSHILTRSVPSPYQYFPLIIQIILKQNAGMSQEQQILFESINYFQYQLQNGKNVNIRPQKRIIIQGSNQYELQEAYGLGNSGQSVQTEQSDKNVKIFDESQNPQGSIEEDAKLCVVCMCQNKNVLSKPCRHVSMCQQCAITILKGRVLDRKCPNCRQHIDDIEIFQIL